MTFRVDRGAQKDKRQARALQRLAASDAAHIHVENEVPAGTINGVNAAFELADVPRASSLMLYVNGLLQANGGDFTLSETTITFLAGAIPETGDVVRATYVKG